jgi:hypothetical protein
MRLCVQAAKAAANQWQRQSALPPVSLLCRYVRENLGGRWKNSWTASGAWNVGAVCAATKSNRAKNVSKEQNVPTADEAGPISGHKDCLK